MLGWAVRALLNEDSDPHWVDSPLFAPRLVATGKDGSVAATFFPGFDRWGIDFEKQLAARGARLREAPDAIVSVTDGEQERMILASEFCGALPAGNNAWQRTGRALACAAAGLPFFYFAELGGHELDAERRESAMRFPNPLIPFAYVTLSRTSGGLVHPVFLPSPSTTADAKSRFAPSYGASDALRILNSLLREEAPPAFPSALIERSLRLLDLLSGNGKRHDALRPSDWRQLAAMRSGTERADWFINKAKPWRKKISVSVTPTFTRLLELFSSEAVAVGSADMPLCILQIEKRRSLAEKVRQLYGIDSDDAFLAWLGSEQRHLVVVWICGFKPRGDDSRPDRGLAPLARMLFETGSVDLLSVIYGPAKTTTWELFARERAALASSNGLWQAILGLSDAVLVDSPTATVLDGRGIVITPVVSHVHPLTSGLALSRPIFGEQDIDTTLHMLFAHSGTNRVFESLCNPPGGDWSGVSILSQDRKTELRWTSLRRVSGEATKRPDHIAQFLESGGDRLVAVESKDRVTSLENGIGPRLVSYVSKLVVEPPNILRKVGEAEWCRNESGVRLDDGFHFSSMGVGMATLKESIEETRQRAGLDMLLGLDFTDDSGAVRVRVSCDASGEWLRFRILELAKSFGRRIEVQVD